MPKLEFVYECDVTLAAALPFGQTVDGTRRIIPITGGTIVGPQIRAELVPGGFDWNLSRSDGAAMVEASYYCRTDDGSSFGSPMLASAAVVGRSRSSCSRRRRSKRPPASTTG